MSFVFSVANLLTLGMVQVADASVPREINQKEILAKAGNLNPAALSSAIAGYRKALNSGEVGNPDVLTVIDFSLPSSAKRLWVIDLAKNEVLMNLRTTHGKNTGMVYATDFSNEVNSKKSSIGTFKTLNSYVGKYGLSLRLDGLDKGVNDNAFRRAIVVHPAQYASQSYFERNRSLGRSWGCFALTPEQSKQFVNLTKNGSIIHAYAPRKGSFA